MFTYNQVVHKLYKGSYKCTKRTPEAIKAGIKRDVKAKSKHKGHNS